MIFTRLMTPATMRRGTVAESLEHAVDAEADAQLAALGREVDVGRALLDGLGDDAVDELDDRGVVGGLAEVDDLGGRLLLLLRRRWTARRRRGASGARSSAAMSSLEATAGRTS